MNDFFRKKRFVSATTESISPSDMGTALPLAAEERHPDLSNHDKVYISTNGAITPLDAENDLIQLAIDCREAQDELSDLAHEMLECEFLYEDAQEQLEFAEQSLEEISEKHEAADIKTTKLASTLEGLGFEYDESVYTFDDSKCVLPVESITVKTQQSLRQEICDAKLWQKIRTGRPNIVDATTNKETVLMKERLDFLIEKGFHGVYEIHYYDDRPIKIGYF
ncbi:MAG: hypothetical protein HQL70_11740 [Magnetococcales bacterium]|nr:hypothetical protein [Magnetococcales bacterium]